MLRLKLYKAHSTSLLYLPPPSLAHHSLAKLAFFLFPPQDLCTCSFDQGIFAWPTSGRSPGHPILNALTSHPTLRLLMACLGHKD